MSLHGNHWLPWCQSLKVEVTFLLQEVMIWTITLFRRDGSTQRIPYPWHIHGDERYIYPIRKPSLTMKINHSCSINIPNSSHGWYGNPSSPNVRFKVSHRLIEIIPRLFFQHMEASTSAVQLKHIDSITLFPLEVPKCITQKFSGSFRDPPEMMGPP